MLFKFIKSIYPVLKEAILGKQTIVDAFRTSKIKVMMLMYCLLSPFVMTYLSNKVVALAKTNIELRKLVVIAAAGNKPIAGAPPSLESAPLIKPPAAPVAADTPARIPVKNRRMPTVVPPSKESSMDEYEELLRKSHERY
jgi:hypothetical protein